jgi:hypothetical protein
MIARIDPDRGTAEPMPPTCPACGMSEGVEKASAVLRRNSGQFSTERSSYQFRSLLAIQLSPPEAPRQPSWQGFAVKIATNLALALLIGAAVYLVNRIAVDVPQVVEIGCAVLVIWFGLITPLKAAVDFIEGRKSIQETFGDWLDARERWSNLYYCSRDDIGFIRGESEYRLPENVSELLYVAVARSAPVARPIATSDAAVPLT